MTKHQLIDELLSEGVEDRHWLENKIEELRRMDWRDHSGVKIRNIKGFLWRGWQGFAQSPYRELGQLDRRLAEVEERIQKVKSDPANRIHTTAHRWEHEQIHAAAYRDFVLGQIEILEERHPQRVASVRESVAAMSGSGSQSDIELTATASLGCDVRYSNDDLLIAALQVEFTPAELPTFPQWAKTNAPYEENGHLTAEAKERLASLYGELKGLRERRSELRDTIHAQ